VVVTVDKYTRGLLTVIAVLLFALVVALWYEAPSVVPAACAAGLPDSSQQLNQIIGKIDEITASVDNLNDLLISGKVRVQLVPSADGKAGSLPASHEPSGQAK
jgi:hypothetical protein